LLASDRSYTLLLLSLQLGVSLVVSALISTIVIRAMDRKTTTITKFEVEKFDGKSNFLLWKMRVTSLLVKEGTQKALLSLRRSHRRWRMISETISTFSQRR